MDPVGRHYRVVPRVAAIGEPEHDRRAVVRQSGDLVAEADASGGHGAGQGGVQVAAVREQIRRAVPLFRTVAEDLVVEHLAGARVAVVPGPGVERLLPHPRLETEPRSTCIALQPTWIPAPSRAKRRACS